MAHITADRVSDTSTTLGTGALTVSGSAPTGYLTFSSVMAVGDTFYYAIQHQTLAQWEVGLGTYSAANQLTRTTVYASSNAGELVSFSAGSKSVFLTLAATRTIQLDAAGSPTNLGANLTAFAGKTAPAGDVVGSSDTQTLTNKTITTVAGFETRSAVAASDINLALGNYFTRTISGATTLTVSNVPASGVVSSLILDLTNGGAGAIIWWAGMKWAGGAPPALTAAGRDVLGFFTHDGGATWSGLVLGKDVK